MALIEMFARVRCERAHTWTRSRDRVDLSAGGADTRRRAMPSGYRGFPGASAVAPPPSPPRAAGIAPPAQPAPDPTRRNAVQRL